MENNVTATPRVISKVVKTQNTKAKIKEKGERVKFTGLPRYQF